MARSFEIAALRAGQTILVNGAGGAVGGYAVQLAKQAGAVVTATAKPAGADRLRRFGADRLIDYIDYTTTPLAVEGQPFDVVLNLVSTTPDETAALAGVVADGGFLVGTMTSGPEDPQRGLRTQRVFVRSDATQLANLVSRVDAGELEVHVAERRPLNEIAAVCTRTPTPGASPARPSSFPSAGEVSLANLSLSEGIPPPVHWAGGVFVCPAGARDDDHRPY